MTLESIQNYLTPLLFIVGAVLLGWIFKTYVHHRIKKLASKTKWQGDDLVFDAIESAVILWFFLGGIYFALPHTDFPENITSLIKSVVTVIFILSVTFSLSRIAAGLLELVTDATGGKLPATTMFTNLIKIFVITVGFLVVFQTLGISITPVLTALGIGGLAISLALKDTLSDFFAGMHILLSKKLRPGDLVELESGERGEVENISWRDTIIRDRRNNRIVIPNSKVSTALIKNFDVPHKEMTVRVACGVGYESDLDQVEKVTLEVAREVLQKVDGGVAENKPSFNFVNFGESSIDFRVSMRVRDYSSQWTVTHEFIKDLHNRFNEEGINIPFPIRTVYQPDLNRNRPTEE